MRVLVTGGAGYIGSVVAGQLVAAGHDVTVLDDLSTGFADAVPPGAVGPTGGLSPLAALAHLPVRELSPTEVVGVHPTANGATLEVTGSGDDLKVNGATVICGGVKTKNATVYLIDTVLTPPAAG